MAFDAKAILPLPSHAALRQAFVGRSLKDVRVPTPAAVLDKAVVERNCHQMLRACEALHVGFRPHVKTHKTVEVAQLQLGDRTNDIKIVVSTVAEAEHLSDFLLSSHQNVNILYGIPLPPSRTERLAYLGTKLGSKSISVLIDHQSQLHAAKTFKQIAGFPLQVFIKIDTGYHRAGVVVGTGKFEHLVAVILDEEARGTVELVGFYSHAGHSYGGDDKVGAMELLRVELEGLEEAAKYLTEAYEKAQMRKRCVLSVGATPTATSIENMVETSVRGGEHSIAEEIAKLKTVIERIKINHVIELHAGVYPLLDMQQLATQASPSSQPHSNPTEDDKSSLSTADIALTIMAEVASVYEDRDSPEALIAAGSLALGREPCKSYSGWGIVSDWGMVASAFPPKGGRRSGWQVGRISQEHGILTRDSQSQGHELAELKIGQRVRVWPNHACVAGAGFGWYLVVDSSLSEEKRDLVVDVWVRCQGW